MRPSPGGSPPRPYDVGELWYRLITEPWSCLVVVAAQPSVNTWRMACSLAGVGSLYGHHQVEPVDALNLNLDRAAAVTHLVAPRGNPRTRSDTRFVVALDCPIDNPIAIGVLAASDAVLLLLEKGISDLPRAHKTIELIGRDRLLGAVLVEE